MIILSLHVIILYQVSLCDRIRYKNIKIPLAFA